MSKFGWSYPAGADNHPMAPYNQGDPPCDVCGLDPAGGDNGCHCPACRGCFVVGVPLTEGLCKECFDEAATTERPDQPCAN